MATDISADVFVAAEPGEVFEYFTRPELLEMWMGEGAVLEPAPGGLFAVDVQGSGVRGRYLEVDPPRRLLITWGFEGSTDLPPGDSTLEVRLAAECGGTRVSLTHRLLPARFLEEHARGWAHYLAHLADVGRRQFG